MPTTLIHTNYPGSTNSFIGPMCNPTLCSLFYWRWWAGFPDKVFWGKHAHFSSPLHYLQWGPTINYGVVGLIFCIGRVSEEITPHQDRVRRDPPPDVNTPINGTAIRF